MIGDNQTGKSSLVNLSTCQNIVFNQNILAYYVAVRLSAVLNLGRIISHKALSRCVMTQISIYMAWFKSALQMNLFRNKLNRNWSFIFSFEYGFEIDVYNHRYKNVALRKMKAVIYCTNDKWDWIHLSTKTKKQTDSYPGKAKKTSLVYIWITKYGKFKLSI